MHEAITLDLDTDSIPVSLTHNGEKKDYELREMISSVRDKYLNTIKSRMLFNPKTGNPQGVKNFEGMQADLLARCLYDSDGNAVPLNTIQEWPASKVTTLFEAAQKLNGLNLKKEEDESKND